MRLAIIRFICWCFRYDTELTNTTAGDDKWQKVFIITLDRWTGRRFEIKKLRNPTKSTNITGADEE